MSVPTRAGVPAARLAGAAPHETGAARDETGAAPHESGSPDPGRLGWLGDPDTILLVEDDAGDVLLVEELLADSGLQASLTAARSLAEAADLLRKGVTPGCILLDLHLPDVQGLDAVTRMLTAAPGHWWSC